LYSLISGSSFFYDHFTTADTNHFSCLHPAMASDEEVNYIMEFYKQLWKHGLPMSSQLLAIELQRVSPQLNHVDIAVLCHHVLCIMKNK
jgi:L-2-hydroxyglutarate oxidase LhgO